MRGATTATVAGNLGTNEQQQQRWISSDSKQSSNVDDAKTAGNRMPSTTMTTNGVSHDINNRQHQRSESNGELKMTGATSRAREGDSGGDEEEYLEIAASDLVFKDEKYKDSFLARLNTLRRNREMCDVVFLVGQREIHAHKVVLAAVSPTLFELLSPKVNQQQQPNREESPTSFGSSSACPTVAGSTVTNGHQQQNVTDKDQHATTNGGGSPSSMDGQSPKYLEFNDVDFDCFEALINYAYNGSLEINNKRVADLYKASSRFRMQSCAEACAKYLVKQLSPQNCIGVRKCANRTNDVLLASKVDGYIQKNFSEITHKSKEFLALPVIQIEVVLCVDGRPEIAGPMKEERRLGEKVIDWLQQQVHDLPEHAVFRMEMLTQKVHMLYLDEDLILQDCQEMDDATTMGSSDMVQDYKKASRRNPASQAGGGSKLKNKVSFQPGASPGPKIARFASTDSMNSLASDNEEVEWKVIAVVRSSDNYYTALSIIRRQLAVLTIRVVDSSTLTRGASLSLSDIEASLPVTSIQQTRLVMDLAVMESPRCSVGAVCLDGKLTVCGGYDRGECLRSVEQYDLVTNRWTKLPDMHKKRGRFDASVLNNKVYAVGGSDGTRDLQCAECYDPKVGQWVKLADMLTPRSNHGVTTADGRVYAIGGCQGQQPVKQCERYDPSTNKWESIAPMQHARFQAGCCALSDQVIVVSGCDMWNCINSVECYDPATNVWRFLPALATARRGCGVGVINGKLYVFGGSDGVHSLCSVEMLDLTDPQAKWRPGPPLNVPRGNVRAVVVESSSQPRGDILFAVGGFNGKSFLNSIEYLEEGATDWSTTSMFDQPPWPIQLNSNPSAVPGNPLSATGHNYLSLNQAKFVINEDPVGESQNETVTTTTATVVSSSIAESTKAEEDVDEIRVNINIKIGGDSKATSDEDDDATTTKNNVDIPKRSSDEEDEESGKQQQVGGI